MPAILASNYQALCSGPIPKEELGKPTPDGLLGTMFPRQVQDLLKMAEDNEIISEKMLYEWLLMTMTGEESRRELGLDHTHTLQELMLEWGYRRPKKWDAYDFDMLLDRLLLKERIEDIAIKYSFTESAVQRRTSRLAKILHIPLPKAPHKEHRRN